MERNISLIAVPQCSELPTLSNPQCRVVMRYRARHIRLNLVYDRLAAQAVPCLRYAWHHLMGRRRPRRLELDVPAGWYIFGHREFVSATMSLALVHNLHQHGWVVF
jgi:hypothetical protein